MWIVLPVLAADRITKVIAAAIEGKCVLIPGILNVRYVENTGIAFSMLSGGGIWLILLTALLVAGLGLWLIMRPDEPKMLRLGIWLIIGGGLGNLYDRIVYGSVIDFFELAFMRFAVFNVADACICIGAGLAVLAMFLDEMRAAREKRPKGN